MAKQAGLKKVYPVGQTVKPFSRGKSQGVVPASTKPRVVLTSASLDHAFTKGILLLTHLPYPRVNRPLMMHYPRLR